MTRVVESRNIEEADLIRLQSLENQGLFQLRDEDTKECLAFGMSPFQAIAYSVANSINSFLVLVDNELVATWGYGCKNPLSGIGYPWLLTTPAIEKHKMFFGRQSYHARDMLLRRFVRLDVVVDARYLRAQLWLERLGFRAHPAAVILNEHPFIYMCLERK